jgi:hypothetical protein
VTFPAAASLPVILAAAAVIPVATTAAVISK